MRHIISHFGASPPGNHLHWYGQHKLPAKSTEQTQKNPTQKYKNPKTIIYYPYTHAHQHNINQQKTHTRTI